MQEKKGSPLYSRWLEVASANHARPALHDLASGESWSFGTLAAMARDAPPAPPVLRSTGSGPRFLIDVLHAWRDTAILLPDESDAMNLPEPTGLPQGVAHLKITSGTSGARRTVLFSAAQLAADARQLVTTMGLHPGMPNLGVISMAHSYGFSNLVLPLLLHGIPLVLAENPLPESLRRALARHPDVALPAVPAMWRAWDRAGIDFAPIRLAISAGAELPLALESAVFERTGLKIHNFYGSSECGGIAYDASSVPRARSNHAGTAIDGVRLDTDPASGCLRVHSAAVGLGYLDGDNADLASGCFRTRDLARVEPDGTVFLLGREGDTVNVAGYKISPAMLEEALLELPGVRACVVFGSPSADPIRVEDLVACVNLEPGTPLDILKAKLASHPPACMPRHWWVCDQLLPDQRGKIPRARWKDLWQQAHDPRLE